MIALHVNGTPRPQPRPRFVGGRVVSTASRHAKFWRNSVMREARVALDRVGPARGDVELDATFYFETPRAERHGKPHTARPDADNLVKLVMDVLADAGILPKGDAVVARVISSKLWAAQPGAVIVLKPIGSSGPELEDDLGAEALEA